MPLKDGGYKLEDVYLRLRVSFSYFSSFSSQEEREVKDSILGAATGSTVAT